MKRMPGFQLIGVVIFSSLFLGALAARAEGDPGAPLNSATSAEAIKAPVPQSNPAPPGEGIKATADPVAVGRRIYQEGTLSDGAPLTGKRWDDVEVTGRTAACTLCHRDSGMGGVEGDVPVQPITGNALFGTGEKVVATMDPRSGKAFNQAHDPYTDETLAQAMRTGLHPDGSRMQAIMPRYELNDADMKALIAYLHQLSVNWSPGVTDKAIRFATVITPEVPAEHKAVYIDMMRKMVAQKNGSTAVAGGSKSRHHMASAAEMVLGTERTWDLDVWELQGAPDTWAQQLDGFYAKSPVFALISGLGDGSWEPIAAFCDRMGIPGWFPSVELPPAGESKYTIYFNQGVRLEANVLASYLHELKAKAPKRLIQVFRDDYVGRGAAQALSAALGKSGVTVEDRILEGSDGAAMTQTLGKLGAKDGVMLWLRPDDLGLLKEIKPPRSGVFLSAKMAGAESAPLPDSWKAATRLVYPYEMPDKRLANLAYFQSWMHQRRIKPVDEMMQSEAYFAVSYLTDTITEMLDNLYRDYLIERAEDMISKREGSKAEAEYYSSTQSHVRTHNQSPEGIIATRPAAPEAPGLTALRQAGTAFHQREGTSAYPRLTLGPGQRFASKGGYIAGFGKGGALKADSKWIVP